MFKKHGWIIRTGASRPRVKGKLLSCIVQERYTPKELAKVDDQVFKMLKNDIRETFGG